MFNPFEEEHFDYSPEAPLPFSLSQDHPSPISFLHLSEQLLPSDPENQDLHDKKLAKFLSQMKSYSQSLEQRNLQMACELQKERNKNKKLTSVMGLLMTTEEQRNKALEQEMARLNENSSKFEVELNRREMIQSEVKALRLENNYLKDLILVANGNYQKLEEKNSQLLQKITLLEQQHQHRQIQMIRKTEELKGMLAAMIAQRGTPEPECRGSPKGTKIVKRQQAEDVYRSIFSKTLRPRKENVHKQ